MGMLYPWATKEYLLWEMSIGQIILYHNIGMELKYGKPGKSVDSVTGLVGLSADELRKLRDEVMKSSPDAAVTEEQRGQYRDKYGDIE